MKSDAFWKNYEKLFDSVEWDNFLKPVNSVITEHKNGDIVINLDVPGFTKEEVKVSVEPGYLHINAKNEKRRYTRSFSINSGYSVDSIEAKLENGVLIITVPYRTTHIETREVVVK